MCQVVGSARRLASALWSSKIRTHRGPQNHQCFPSWFGNFFRCFVCLEPKWPGCFDWSLGLVKWRVESSSKYLRTFIASMDLWYILLIRSFTELVFQNLQNPPNLRFPVFPFWNRPGRENVRKPKSLFWSPGHESIRKRSAMHFVPFECNNRFQPEMEVRVPSAECVGKIFGGDFF